MASRRGFLRLSRVLPTLCKHGNHFTCLQCGLEVGWAEVIRQTVSFLLVCVCVFVGWRVGWVGIIRHQIFL